MKERDRDRERERERERKEEREKRRDILNKCAKFQGKRILAGKTICSKNLGRQKKNHYYEG